MPLKMMLNGSQRSNPKITKGHRERAMKKREKKMSPLSLSFWSNSQIHQIKCSSWIFTINLLASPQSCTSPFFCQQGCIFQLQHLAAVHKGFRGVLKHRHASMHICTHHYTQTITQANTHTHTHTQGVQGKGVGGGVKEKKKKKHIELAQKLTAV